MNHIDRKIIAELKNGINYEQNLPLYTTQMLHLEYEYSVILAALHYYTLGEVVAEAPSLTDTGLPEDFMELVKGLKTCVYDGFVRGDHSRELLAEAVKRLDTVRNTIIHKMQLLTAYTDILQIYEYVLNRLEAELLDLVEPVDAEALSDQLFQYIFKENDTMVINSKLQMVTAQLPMRMTRAKFFDTVSQAFSIYNGSERCNFDEFVERIRSTVLLDKPEGYETEYPQIYGVIEKLAGLDYKKLTKEQFLQATEELSSEAAHIREIVTDYLMLTDVVNSIYAALLAMPYANVVSDALSNSQEIIKLVYAAMEDAAALEKAAEKLVLLEGEQEQLLEELGNYEGIFYEVKTCVSDDDSGSSPSSVPAAEEDCMDKLSVLELMQQLHSNSVFIDLKKEAGDGSLADGEYIGRASKKFEADMTALLSGFSRPVKRAYMAAVIGQLPVIFNNTQEIQEYIKYTLHSCSNDSELYAVKTILEDMMTE